MPIDGQTARLTNVKYAPRISVVMPTFNSADFVRGAIESALGQDYPGLELIVIDGGSDDGTAEIVEEHHDQLALYISEPDGGQSDAINKGLRRSTGDFVGWLNADDTYLPGTLTTVAANADVDWIVGRTVLTDIDGNVLGLAPRSLPVSEWSEDAWLSLACARLTGAAIGPAAFWSRRALETTGLLDMRLSYVMDADYWIRLLKSGFFPRFVEAEMVAARKHPAQKSAPGNALSWCLEVMRLNSRLRRSAGDDAARRQLARYQRWTLTHRLPHALAAWASARLEPARLGL